MGFLYTQFGMEWLIVILFLGIHCWWNKLFSYLSKNMLNSEFVWCWCWWWCWISFRFWIDHLVERTLSISRLVKAVASDKSWGCASKVWACSHSKWHQPSFITILTLVKVLVWKAMGIMTRMLLVVITAHFWKLLENLFHIPVSNSPTRFYWALPYISRLLVGCLIRRFT